jgi:hypothetical protein
MPQNIYSVLNSRQPDMPEDYKTINGSIRIHVGLPKSVIVSCEGNKWTNAL